MTTPNETRPPEGSPYWYEPGNATNGVCEDYEVLHGPDGFMCFLSEPEDRWFTRDARPVVAKLNEQHAELAALRARLAKLEAKPETPTPEVGKVYWARRLYKGMPCGPFRLQVLALTPKIIEYRENNWSGIRSAIMRDDLEIVEETTWE